MANQKAKITQPTPMAIEEAAALIKSGEVVGMPTETVYGLAGDATNPNALAKIFSVKERPTFDPLIVHLPLNKKPTIDWLNQLGLIEKEKMSQGQVTVAEKLMESFWPGPLTIILPKGPKIPDLVTSGLPSVALRMPAHPIAQELIQKSETPLAAPSANRFGRISPTRPEHVFHELGDRIKLILDGGACSIGLESTVVSLDQEGKVSIMRPGGLPQEKIQSLLKTTIDIAKNPVEMASPGLLESHYAPVKKLFLLKEKLNHISAHSLKFYFKNYTSIAFLAMSGDKVELEKKIFSLTGVNVLVYILSPQKNWEEAAQNLFQYLREMDNSHAELLIAELPEAETGLCFAILDRLKKAASKDESNGKTT